MSSFRVGRERLLMKLANQTVNTDNPRVGYLWLCNIMSIDSFTDRALRVLFSSESSEADYLIVSIGLYWLFFILSIASPDQDLGTHVRREDLVKEGRLCRENLETSLSTMPFHFPGDEDHVEALIMAVGDSTPTCNALDHLLRRHTSHQLSHSTLLITRSRPWPGHSVRPQPRDV